MLDDFLDFMNDTVAVEQLILRDGYGAATYGPAISYLCRVSGKQQQVVDAMGLERTSHATVYIMGTATIGPTDRLTLPVGFTPQQPPIIQVNALSDEAGAHHVEVLV